MWNTENRKSVVLLLPLLLVCVGALCLLHPLRGHRARTTYPEELVDPSTIELFEFDPNTIDYRSLRRLGFTKRQAIGIIHYREAGKVFREPTDFAGCYQVNDTMFDRLEPYIHIADKYKYKSRSYR